MQSNVFGTVMFTNCYCFFFSDKRNPKKSEFSEVEELWSIKLIIVKTLCVVFDTH